MKSEEAKKEIEAGLKNLDSKALTSEGKMKSYEIDYESVVHNPMGGNTFDVIVNNNSEFRVYNTLSKNNSNGSLKNSGELEDLLKGIY
ncbi:DUF1310 family protein [Enterococcus faecalis]|uniref:DUF1310 family protein n=1 Tax=Enterococcus faecalis TaxID=1351 RepID=UPI003D772457